MYHCHSISMENDDSESVPLLSSSNQFVENDPAFPSDLAYELFPQQSVPGCQPEAFDASSTSVDFSVQLDHHSVDGNKIVEEIVAAAVNQLDNDSKRECKEPLLDTSAQAERFIIHPIEHPEIYEMYKRQLAVLWQSEEVDFSTDYKCWLSKLTKEQRKYFKCILAFFAPSDGIVTENLITRFFGDVTYTEARFFYVIQAAIENIHAETYALIIKCLIPDELEQNRLFREFLTTPAIQRKVDWECKWLGDDGSFAERLVAFAVIEGLLFSGSFASIFWLKNKGFLNGLTFANELISRDEGLHRDFACLLYTKHVKNKLPKERVYEIIESAVDVEREFFEYAFQGNAVGILNISTMMDYIRYCADHLCVSLGVPSRYGVKNPYKFMHTISLDGKTNFFERRVGEYRNNCYVRTATEIGKLPPGPIELSLCF